MDEERACPTLAKAWGHFRTITHHRHLVMEGCFKVGLYRQGLLHDLSKYTPTEFLPGARYFQGNRSPNNAQREEEGVSTAWLHHKGRNKHHLEYWIDYNLNREDQEHPLAGGPMPVQYVIEMFIDRIAACKNYQKDAYTDESPLEYYNRGRDRYLLHPRSRRQLEILLGMLAREGEERTFRFIRTRILRNSH